MAPSNNTTYSSQGKNPTSTKKHIAVVLYVLSISLGLEGLFNGLKITQASEVVLKHQGKYPVIFLT